MNVERKRNVAVYVRVASAQDVSKDTEAQRRATERYCRENNLVVATSLRTTRLAVESSSREMLRALAQFAFDASVGQGSDRGGRHAL